MSTRILNMFLKLLHFAIYALIFLSKIFRNWVDQSIRTIRFLLLKIMYSNCDLEIIKQHVHEIGYGY